MTNRITNKHYRQFLDEGIIELVNEEGIIKVLDNLKSRHRAEARALVICMYYTGARPNEVLRLVGKDITLVKNDVIIRLKGSKKGVPRPVYLSYTRPLVKEFYKYASAIFADMFLFWHFRDSYKRTVMTKKGVIERVDYGNKIRYHFTKWFSCLLDGGVPPYYLRHNRISKLAENGASIEELRMFKGSRTYDSVMPYIHMSTYTAKKISKRIN
jgi:integrase